MADGSHTLSESEISRVESASNAISSLSVIGSWSILLVYLRFKRLRSLAYFCVVMLSCADIGNQIANFASPSPGDLAAMEAGAPTTPTCLSQAISDSFFELSSVLWTTGVAYILFQSVIKRRHADVLWRQMPWLCVFCFGLPLLLALLPLADHAYGPTGAWCWIISSKLYWRAIQFYAPLWIAIVFNSVVYWRVVRLLRRTVASSGPHDVVAIKMRAIIGRLQWFPLILLVVWVPATVNRIYETASGGQQLFWLFLLQRCFSSSQGLLNSIAYGLSDGVRQAIAGEVLAPMFKALGCARLSGWLGHGGSDSSGGVGGSSRGGGTLGAATADVNSDDSDILSSGPTETTAVLVSAPGGMRLIDVRALSAGATSSAATAASDKGSVSAAASATVPVGSDRAAQGPSSSSHSARMAEWGGPKSARSPAAAVATGAGAASNAFSAAHDIPRRQLRQHPRGGQGPRSIADISVEDEDDDELTDGDDG